MNIIEAIKPSEVKPYRQADIFYQNNEYFILAAVDAAPEKLYCAISFKDGNRWLNPTKYIDDAVKGLTFAGRDVKISISK